MDEEKKILDAVFYRLFHNIAGFYKGRNLQWQLLTAVLTYISVFSGFDWFYSVATRNAPLQAVLFPGVLLGLLVPLILPIILYVIGIARKDSKALNAAYAIVQSGLVALGVSSFYKIFTGRIPPPQHYISYVDTSHIFKFGLFRGGTFWGWPSSHATVAFAVALTLVVLYRQNKIVKWFAFLFAFYVAIGVSANIHWFSDSISGAIIGSVIGVVIGKSFLERYSRL